MDYNEAHTCYLVIIEGGRLLFSFILAMAGVAFIVVNFMITKTYQCPDSPIHCKEYVFLSPWYLAWLCNGIIIFKSLYTKKVDQQQYLGIVDNKQDFLLELNACVVLGVLVFVLSLVKELVSCGDNSKQCSTCQQVLFLITTILFVLEVVNFGIVISAGTKSTGKTLEAAYLKSANRTFLDYNHNEFAAAEWDHFQIKHECCGVSAASNYVQIFHQSNIVPESCCNQKMLHPQGILCSDIVANVSADDLMANRIYNKGCVEAVISDMKDNYIVAVIFLFAFFILLLENLVLSCIIAINYCFVDED